MIREEFILLRILPPYQKVLAIIQASVLESWELASPDSAPDAIGEAVLGDVRGCHFALSTRGPGQVLIEAYVAVAWNEEHGVAIDLVAPDDRSSWSFL